MLKTLYDYTIFKDFMASQPSNVLGDDFRLWRNYYEFLKSGTDLTISNPPENPDINLLNELTTGRGNSNISLGKKVKGFYKNIVPKSYDIDHLFFMDESRSEEQKKYRLSNPYFFAFINDHIEAFAKLSFTGKSSSIIARAGSKYNQFTSWDLLSKNILPFSDCIIIDRYIFKSSQSELERNIGKIIQILDAAAPAGCNILILTYRGEKDEVKMPNVKRFLDEFKVKNKIRGNISVIVTHKIEHDRHMFMNYMRINSGSSFNYFDQSGRLNVKTEIQLLPYIDYEKYYNAQIILSDVSVAIKDIIIRADPNEVYGDCKNRLLRSV